MRKLLTYAVGLARGGVQIRWKRGRVPPIEHEIPEDQWVHFFSSFTSRHRDWLVSVDVLDSAHGRRLVHDAPLAGISLDGDRVAITVFGGHEAHFTHVVEHPNSVILGVEPSGAEESLKILSGGTATRVRFRSPLLPEMVDGMP